MSSEHVVVLEATATLILDSCIHVKESIWWVPTKLKESEKKHSGSGLVKDLILDGVDELNVQ